MTGKMTYIIIINWNNWADTIECLESVFRLNYDNYRVIVCDNDSSDNSIHFIKAWANGSLSSFPSTIETIRSFTFPSVTKPVQLVCYERSRGEHGGDVDEKASLVLIQTGDNLGFAGGNNVGLRYALAKDDFQYVWLLNNDTVVAHDALQNMVDRIEQSDKIGMLGSTLLNFSDGLLQAAGGGKYNRLTANVKPVLPEQAILPDALDYVSAASMLISRDYLKKVGLLSEEYFLYFEELDLAYRGQYYGYTISYAPRSIVYHKGGASIGSGRRADYYAYRNKIVFTRKFLPRFVAAVYFWMILSALTKLITGQFRRFTTIVRVFYDINKTETPFST